MNERSNIRRSNKVILVTLHYLPVSNTTSGYMAELAESLAQKYQVLVLSGAPGSARNGNSVNPHVVEIKSWWPAQSALFSRSIAAVLFAVQAFAGVIRHARRNDIVVCVTTPFTSPYTTTLAARIRGALSALIIYDVYPDSLVLAGVIERSSFTEKALKWANGIIFRWLNAIIVIGRDMKELVLTYAPSSESKIVIIPNWLTLPVRYREIDTNNKFRRGHANQFIVGMSGTSGFTHDAESVFAAARLLQTEANIHFILSGEGVGWTKLKGLQSAEKLSNVTLLERVPQADLETFLEAANVWLIPYRKNNNGISVPSRIYNLLAVGRPVIVCSEPQAEAALLVEENDIGWVVKPENVDDLAQTIRIAASAQGQSKEKGQRAAMVAPRYARETSLEAYRNLIAKLMTEQTDRDRRQDITRS